ncbi:hypothetical protein J6590_074199 [Homalodisca vitripennis]|nr:hypothetical protein J6590_074199 [Homalodisca vitripennis]
MVTVGIPDRALVLKVSLMSKQCKMFVLNFFIANFLDHFRQTWTPDFRSQSVIVSDYRRWTERKHTIYRTCGKVQYSQVARTSLFLWELFYSTYWISSIFSVVFSPPPPSIPLNNSNENEIHKTTLPKSL